MIKILLKMISILSLVVVASCAWEQPGGKVTLVMSGRGRDLLASTNLSFSTSQSLVLKLTDYEGKVIAQKSWTQTAAEYRLEADGLIYGNSYRAMALLTDTEHYYPPNLVTHMDVKEFLYLGQRLALNLRLGHTFADLEISTDYIGVDIIEFDSQKFSYPGLTVDPMDTQIQIFPFNDYHPSSFNEFEYSFNGSAFATITDFNSSTNLPLKIGKNLLVIRYRQESDNQFVTYRFEITR